MADLAPGTSLVLDPSSLRVLSIDVRWNTGSETALANRIAVAAMPLVRDRVESREHVVFSNQPSTPDETTRLGAADGVVEVDLVAAPQDVERVVVLVFVQPRPNMAKRTLDQVSELVVTFRDDATGQELGRSTNLVHGLGPVSAAVLSEITREAQGWRAAVEVRGYEAGLDGALQAVGARL